MAVTAAPGDANGAAIDARITALAANLATGKIPGAADLLAQTQVEAVYHYMAKGRISAATILSTLSKPSRARSNSGPLLHRNRHAVNDR